MSRFAITANMYKPEASELIKEAARIINNCGGTVKIPASYCEIAGAEKVEDEERLYENIDFLIVLGGDGTLIDRAKKAAVYGIPVVGVNLGRVGYLSALEKNELYKLGRLSEGNYKIIKRSMLSVTVNGAERIALNDAVFAEARASRMINTEISVNKEKITRYASTALIVCTPTGSSGFNMSAGGPAVDTSASCLILTPVCPHTTSSRSFVFGDGSEIEVRNVSTPDKKVFLTLDGAEDAVIERNDSVVIKKSPLYASTVVFDDMNFASKILKRIGN